MESEKTKKYGEIFAWMFVGMVLFSLLAFLGMILGWGLVSIYEFLF